MDAHSADSAASRLPDSRLTQSAGATSHTAPTARTIVRTAVVLALTADALFYDGGPMGPALLIWVALLALTTASIAWTHDGAPSREALGWLASAVLFAGASAWRDAAELTAFNFLAMVASLGMAAVALSDARGALFATRLRDTIWAGMSMVRDVAFGIVPVALRDAYPAEARQRGGPVFRRAARALVITVPLVVVFGALLLSADPVFASLAPAINIESVLSHGFVIGFFAWIVAGWAGHAFLDRRAWRAPDRLPVTLDTLDITIALGTLNALFAAFLLTQLGWLFGGEAFLRARTGLTVAQFARTGFFQLVVAAVLVVPLLVATRAALRPARDVAIRHTMLALPMIALVIAMLVSAATRLRLYVHYFGLTTDRFYPAVFMGWLAVVLVWFAVTVLRGWGRPFVAGAVLSGLATLAALNVANPDVFIARADLRRGVAIEGRVPSAVDVAYLANLSGHAVHLAADATLAPPRAPIGTPARESEDAARCSAAKRLLQLWGSTSQRAVRYDGPASWRYANAGEIEGLRAVAARAPALRAIARACPAEVQR